MAKCTNEEAAGVVFLSLLAGVPAGLISTIWLHWPAAIGVGFLVFFISFLFWANAR